MMTIKSGTMSKFAEGLDLIVDGTDNFPTRFVINDYCVHAGLPWIYGGVVGTSGMSMTIVPGQGPCLRCQVREVPASEIAPTAEVAGVLNTAVAIIASVEATEALKLLICPEARNRGLLVVDVWDLFFQVVDIQRDTDCPTCSVALPGGSKGGT
jgi:molybdopterin/thiamine biosynthesis adenylyltransferase